jgi:anaerobic magnesium-protoporphyrin IX monomethyl ester cyclase
MGEGQAYVKHGLGIISACLKKEGHQTFILNNPEEIACLLPEFQPDVVGVSGLSNSFPQMLECAKITRIFSHDVVIFAGGVAPTLAPDDFDNGSVRDLFDYVFCGEGEITFTQIINEYGATGSLPEQRRIRGVAVHELDLIPFADRSGYEEGESKHRLLRECSGHMHTMINSRRCRMQCRFCAPASKTIFGDTKKLRSVDNFISEIKTLHANTSLMIHDDNLIENALWAEEFSEKFSSMARPFICQGYPAQIVKHEALLKKLSKCGLKGILVGIESGSDRMLRHMRKGTTRAINIEAAKVLHRLGIGIQANLMFGCPTETHEEMMETVSLFNEHIYPAIASPAIYTPYPGSAWYEELKEQGLITINDCTQYERGAKTSGKIRGVDYQDVHDVIYQLKGSKKSWWKRKTTTIRSHIRRTLSIR